ncbi:MAG: TIGR00725 family protein [archaeon]
MQISVIGSSEASKEVLDLAEQVGKEIAKAGATLICGGTGGVMEAACRGAHSEEGITVGILPNGKDGANKYVDIKIQTHLGHMRNSLVASSGDAVIAIAGSLGTLSEVMFAMTFNKPIILLSGSGGISDYWETFSKLPEIKDKAEYFNANISFAKTPKEAVELALKEIT